MPDSSDEREAQRQLDELRASLIEASQQIERGEYLDMDEAFDQMEIELFGHKLADEFGASS
jgi:hypothetical protein